MKKILVPGGAGYVGSVLAPHLLSKGYDVTIYDICFFGTEHLPTLPNLHLVQGDIRDTSELAKSLGAIDVVLHLACISNDPSSELDEALSKSIIYDCFESMVIAAKKAGVKRFVYCSSSSVYGVSDQPDVTEEHPLVPVSALQQVQGNVRANKEKSYRYLTAERHRGPTRIDRRAQPRSP